MSRIINGTKELSVSGCYFINWTKLNIFAVGGAGANEEVTVRHFFHGEGDSVPNWDSIV